MGEAKTLKVQGKEFVKVYRAKLSQIVGHQEKSKDPEALSTHQRHFCQECGSSLWAFNEKWSDWVYPFASCIDTPLPTVPVADQKHIMCEFKAPWITVPEGVPEKARYAQYPNTGIAAWHKEHGKYGTWKPPTQE